MRPFLKTLLVCFIFSPACMGAQQKILSLDVERQQPVRTDKGMSYPVKATVVYEFKDVPAMLQGPYFSVQREIELLGTFEKPVVTKDGKTTTVKVTSVFFFESPGVVNVEASLYSLEKEVTVYRGSRQKKLRIFK